MKGNLEEQYLETQAKLNLSEFYNNEEIKLLKKTIPDISNIIYLASNNELNTKINNDKANPYNYQYRYLSPLRKIKNNINTSFLIDKEKFYILILDTAKHIFEKEQNFLLSKSISLVMEEILNMSKIIKQNLIYNKFFKSIKNTKILSSSINKDKDKSFQNVKNKNISVISKNNSKKKKIYQRNTNTNENLKILVKSSKETDINNNSGVKKHLSFTNEMDKKNNKNTKNYSKSQYDINLLPKEKEKEKEKEKNNKTNANSIIKNNSSNNTIKNINKNKNKTSYDDRIINKKNNNKNNVNSMNTSSSSQIKPNKKQNNNFLIGPSKISLKKNTYHNKRFGVYDFINNKTEYNLTSLTQNNKKSYKEKDNKDNKENKENKSLDKKNTKKIISPKDINSDLYKNIETQEFNIFNLEKKIGRENILPLIGYYIFNAFGFDEIIKYYKFEKWCQKISEGYIRNNYYHNDLHAADITQTCMLYFKLGEFDKTHKFNKSDLCSLFLSCICHDYQHPGVNNNFLKETSNKLSIRYNDASILENMHISSTFKLILNNKECNIFENVDTNVYKQIRKQMISCVLATDMAFHNIYVEFLKNCNQAKNEDNKEANIDNKKKEEEHQKYMNLLIHSSDISNPTKLFDIYFEWAKLVVEEFWDQGDKEKKLNLICSCDREKVSIYQSQLGFINFIEIPYFSLLAELDPKLKFFYDNLLNNKNILLSMQEKEKEKQKEKKEEKSEKLKK